MPLLYDRDCGFCRFATALVLAWDRHRRIRPVAIQDAEGVGLLADVPAEKRLASAHVVENGGVARSGGALAAPVLRRLPGGRPLARLAERSPTTVERAYAAVAGRRATLGRRVPAGARRWADRVIADRGSQLRH